MGFEINRAKKEEKSTRDLISSLDKTLDDYQQGLSGMRARLKENEDWYSSKHWPMIRNPKLEGEPEPVTAYLFNTLFNKHADFMDNFAYPNYLPNEEDDQQEAELLSKLMPAVLDKCNPPEYASFKTVYSSNTWEKLKHGGACYGVLWDSDRDHGIGDLSITKVDLMNCYWLPGINNIQESPKFYIATSVANAILELQYPDIDLKKTESSNLNDSYRSKESKDNFQTSRVVDCYSKERVDVPLDMEPLAEGMEPQTESKVILRYIKYIGKNLIYDSFDDPEHPEYQFTGYYIDNMFPFVIDVMFEEKDSPIGFSLLDVLKSPQMYIDKLDQIILRNAARAGRVKHLVRKDLGLKVEDLVDTSVDAVEFEGSLNENNYKQYQPKNLAAFVYNHRATKIDEIKDIGTTMDFNRGDAGAGITAASAIALLQEAGNKTSRDMLDTTYEAKKKIFAMCVERIRQFYTIPKSIRLETGNPEKPYEIVPFSNEGLQDQTMETEDGMVFTRRPYFDIKVVPEKKTPYSQVAHNEMAKELFQYGFFNPQMATAATVAMEMMKFEGKEAVLKKIQQNDVMFQQFQQMQMGLQQLQQENLSLKAIVQDATGQDLGVNMDELRGGQQNDQG